MWTSSRKNTSMLITTLSARDLSIKSTRDLLHESFSIMSFLYNETSAAPTAIYSNLLAAKFVGHYHPRSPEYKHSCTHATLPAVYHRQLLHFLGTRPLYSNAEFSVAQPITVTIGLQDGDSDGHAYYGLVVAYNEQPVPSSKTDTEWSLTVELHVIPDYLVDWTSALPWMQPPRGCVFVQPHGFLEADYAPPTVDIMQSLHIMTIVVDAATLDCGLWNDLEYTRPYPRLPPREVYPQHLSPSPIPDLGIHNYISTPTFTADPSQLQSRCLIANTTSLEAEKHYPIGDSSRISMNKRCLYPCQRCKRQKKGCDGAQPCIRCHQSEMLCVFEKRG
jgi:hypothetical protein